MIEHTFPSAIVIDCCWHNGRIVVARHTGAELYVESFAADLSNAVSVMPPIQTSGNAGCRVCSHQGVLWLAYRDSQDTGHLLRLDNGTTQDLTPFYNGGRPFAFGNGQFAWQTTVTEVHIIELSAPIETARTQTFPDFIPTGLSHIDGQWVYSWEDMRLYKPWAVGFHVSGPYVFGEDFDNHGLMGAVEGLDGHFYLWRDHAMHDPRVAESGACAVVAWATGGPARLAVVTVSDLTTDIPPEPEPPDPNPPEPEPPMPIPDQTAVVASVRAHYPTPLGNQHAACLLEIARTLGAFTGYGWTGLLTKDSGTNVVLPDGTRVAQDIMCYANGDHYDCLQDAEGAANPTWAYVGIVDPARYYAVSETPDPQPEPRHAYDGGDNDTGECDVILSNGQKCNQAPGAAIHDVDTDPEPPEPPPNGDTLAEILYELRRLSYHLGVRP